jgi:hypothetical protein
MKYSSLLSLLAAALMAFSLSYSASGQSFQRTIYSSPNGPSDVFVADLNHDGKLDLLTTESNSNKFTVFLNKGTGTFPDGGSLTFLVGGSDTVRVIATDFNGDGIPDVATLACGSGGPGASVLFGNGDGSFVRNRDYNNIEFAEVPNCEDALGFITLAGDSLPSLLFSTRNSQITILRNDGHGTFSRQQTILVAPGTVLSGASAGDYNGDGLQDIATISTDFSARPQHVVIFYQKPDGTFRPPVTVFTRDSELQAANTVDFNGDGRGDLLVPFLAGPDLRAGVVALTNLGGGMFKTTVLAADPFYTFAGRKAAAIHPRGKQAGLRGIVAPLSPNFGTGHSVFAFFPAMGATWGKPIYFDDPGGEGSQATANGDFSGDKRPDFAAVDNSGKLLVFLNTTTAATCAYPNHAGVRICSPVSTGNSLIAKIHSSASGGALPIVAMKAYIDGNLVAGTSMNTLDASVQVKAGRHTLTVNAWDPNDKVYQSVARFNTR